MGCRFEAREVRPEMWNILFVCTGNTCRSVLSEYLGRQRLDPSSVNCESAGLRLVPTEDASNAIDALRRNFGIDASAHEPRAVAKLDLSHFDAVVAIDDPGGNQVFKALFELGVRKDVILRWKISDPWDGHDPTSYDRCALEVVKNLAKLKFAIRPK
jgi:protein-tyrosine-phosphatase